MELSFFKEDLGFELSPTHQEKKNGMQEVQMNESKLKQGSFLQL